MATLNIDKTKHNTTIEEQVEHLKSELDELLVELHNGKQFAALLETGDVVVSAVHLMHNLIMKNNYKCNLQNVFDLIKTKNKYRGYYE